MNSDSEGSFDGRLEDAVTARASSVDLRIVDLLEIAGMLATWPSVLPQLRTDELAHFVASQDDPDTTYVSIRRVVGYYTPAHELEPDDEPDNQSWVDIGVEFTIAAPFPTATIGASEVEFAAPCSVPDGDVEPSPDLLRCGEWLARVAEFVGDAPAGTKVAYRPYPSEIDEP
jgi:hypothetical protein